MKKIIVLIISMGLSVLVSAQDTDKLEEMFEKTVSRLQLSETQQGDYSKVMEEYLGSLSDIKSSKSGRMEKFKKFRSANSTKDAKIKSFLSKDQYSEYVKLKDENKSKFQEMRKNRDK